MAQGNVVAAVRSLATAAQAKGHKLNGAVLTPAQWGAEAGFPGSASSPLRKHIARQSSNGCGRNSRYGAQDAKGMIALIDLGEQYVKADTKAKAGVVSTRVAKQLAVNKAKVQAKATAKAKTVTRKQERKAKVQEVTAA